MTSLENSPYVLTNHLWSKDYIWRDRLLLATNAPTSPGSSTTVTYHYHLDHLGTPRLVTQSGGTVAGRHTYYPFGAEMETNNQQETPVTAMKFTGHERDQIVGDNHTTDYMHARLYNANLGRFLMVDPRGPTGNTLQTPQSWNLYTYSGDSPINSLDPDGKATKRYEAVALVAGAAAAGVERLAAVLQATTECHLPRVSCARLSARCG